ncbi:MAG: sigma-54-dependent transcriptional regulator [Pirellulales bacterium]|jgi:DNA-binding NtrC family response regulator
MSRVLVVDDEPAIGWSLREILGDLGHEVQLAASAEGARETCLGFRPDCILLDVRLPGEDGLSAIPRFRELAGDVPIVVMTAFGDLNTAVRAVDAGAFEYLIKPFDLAKVSEVVARATQERSAANGHEPPLAIGEPTLIGSAPSMQQVFKQIALVAPSEIPVLLTGETGTGKDLAARLIHAHGPRHHAPFVATNLGGLPAGLVESELFGHVRGGFTGATHDRAGLFEAAAGGTIFLDEVSEASPEVQIRLLRVLENREVVRVGSTQPVPLSVRVIAASNRDLSAAVAEGSFREDLYHRLAGFPIRMPALAERTDDIPALVAHFVRGGGGNSGQVHEDFLEACLERRWPGNVRQLKRAVDYALVVSRGSTLRPEHLPDEPVTRAELLLQGVSLAEAVRCWVDVNRASLGDATDGQLHQELTDQVERVLFTEVLAATAGNRTAAARLLGLDRATLRTRLKSLGIDGDV